MLLGCHNVEFNSANNEINKWKKKKEKNRKPYANIARTWTQFNVEIFKEIEKREEFHTPMNLTKKNK